MKTNKNLTITDPTTPQVFFLKKSEIPEGTARGRVGFLNKMLFWDELLYILGKGLTPSEAIEIELKTIKTTEGKEITAAKLLSAIRHQFHKLGLSKKYSLILRGQNSRLFITDHATAGLA